MARHNRRDRISPFQRQAQDLTLVRYGPELSALTQLLRQAQQDRRVGVRQARAGGEMLVSAIDQARPGVRATYSNAGLANRRAAKTLIGSDLATLQGPAADTFRGAAGVEQLAASNALQAQRVAALGDLAERRVSAQQGAVAGERAARTQYTTARGQIAQRVQDLAREEGAYTSSTMMQLLQADAQARAEARRQRNQLRVQIRGQRQQERDALISQGFDPETGKPITGGKLDPNTPLNQAKIQAAKDKANKPNKPAASDRAAAADYGKALSWLGSLDTPAYWKKLGHHDPATRRAALKEILLKGARDQGIPAIPQAVLAAALDTHFQKYLSRNTVRLLHQQGYKVKHFPNVTTKAPPRPTGPVAQAEQRVAVAPNDWLQQLFAGLNVGAGIPGPPRKPPVRPRRP